MCRELNTRLMLNAMCKLSTSTSTRYVKQNTFRNKFLKNYFQAFKAQKKNFQRKNL